MKQQLVQPISFIINASVNYEAFIWDSIEYPPPRLFFLRPFPVTNYIV